MKTHKKEGINVDIRSKDSVYITIGKWVIYIDNSTGEYIIDSWVEGNTNIQYHTKGKK